MDLIDRERAIAIIDELNVVSFYEANEHSREAYKDIRIAIEQLPSADKTGKWISVSERLPEEDTEVLICYKHREGEGDTNHARIDITSYGDMYFGGNRIVQTKHWRQPFEYFALNYEVVAWMPLPEPYNCGARMEEE